MRTRLAVAIGFAVVVVLAYLAIRRASHMRVDPASHPLAANFSLTGLDGRQIALADYRGRVVLLNFWATWCQPCRTEIPEFINLQNKYRGQGLQVLGVSMDDDSKPVVKFRDEFHVNYPIVMGNAAVGEGYGGVLGLPITFLIDRDGRIDAKHIGAVDISKLKPEIQGLLSRQ